jgi:hypothetical protein
MLVAVMVAVIGDSAGCDSDCSPFVGSGTLINKVGKTMGVGYYCPFLPTLFISHIAIQGIIV